MGQRAKRKRQNAEVKETHLGFSSPLAVYSLLQRIPLATFAFCALPFDFLQFLSASVPLR